MYYILVDWCIYEHSKDGVTTNPVTTALKLVYSFDKYTSLKLKSEKDELLQMLINFVGLTSRFMMFKEANIVGDSLMVESLYNEYLPVLVHRGKSKYYDIILDQIDE